MAKICTSLADQPVRAVPKKVNHGRGSRKRKERGAITPECAEQVIERAGGLCEMCGRPPQPGTFRSCLELAHLEQRGQLGRGDDPANIAHLCGPSVNSGTCHWMIDSRRKSHRDWIDNKIAELRRLYEGA